MRQRRAGNETDSESALNSSELSENCWNLILRQLIGASLQNRENLVDGLRAN